MNLEEAMQITRPINYTPDEVLEDLTGKRQAYLDQQNIRELIQGKVVMVTGAAGSIGAELCQQIAGFCPLALVGFDQAETPLFELGVELEKKFPNAVFHSEIGNITRFRNRS